MAPVEIDFERERCCEQHAGKPEANDPTQDQGGLRDDEDVEQEAARDEQVPSGLPSQGERLRPQQKSLPAQPAPLEQPCAQTFLSLWIRLRPRLLLRLADAIEGGRIGHP